MDPDENGINKFLWVEQADGIKMKDYSWMIKIW